MCFGGLGCSGVCLGGLGCSGVCLGGLAGMIVVVFRG